MTTGRIDAPQYGQSGLFLLDSISDNILATGYKVKLNLAQERRNSILFCVLM